MREQFVIEGNHRLQGEVTVSGNKNAALKMLPACLLTDEPVILTNMPDIADVRVTFDTAAQSGRRGRTSWVSTGSVSMPKKSPPMSWIAN